VWSVYPAFSCICCLPWWWITLCHWLLALLVLYFKCRKYFFGNIIGNTHLQKLNPWLLTRYVPVDVLGDGNCFFRALSYSLYGCEGYHALLRLLCVIEVLCNRSLYDTSDPQYYAAYKADSWLVLPDYVNFVSQLEKLSSYCEMLAVLTASSVTQKASQTLWPLSVAPG